MNALIQLGQSVLNLGAVAGAKWDREVLYVYLVGGKFMRFSGPEAQCVWQALTAQAVPLQAEDQ